MMRTCTLATVATAKEGVSIKVYRPAYDPGRVMLSHDATSFHCYFHLSPADARMLRDALLAEIADAESGETGPDEPREVTTRREHELLTVRRPFPDKSIITLQHDGSGVHIYFDFDIPGARAFSDVLLALAIAAEEYIAKRGAA